MTDKKEVVVNAMTRVVDPGYDEVESEDGTKTEPASDTTDPNRLTIHVPTHSTVFSLGKATEEEHWGNWHGTWGGITGVTERDLWLASSGACIIAGYVGPEHRPDGFKGFMQDVEDANRAVNPMSGAKGVTVEDVDKVREQAEETVKVAEVVLASLGAVDYLLHFTPGFMGYVSGATTALGVGTAIYNLAMPGHEGQLHEGAIQLHGMHEVLLTSPRAVRTASTMTNTVLAGVTAEVVAGWCAGLRGMAWAEVAAYYGVEIKAVAQVDVVSDWKVDISSRRGTVEVQGPTVEIGRAKIAKTGFLLGRQKPTQTVEVSAADEIALKAGPDGEARLELHGHDGKVVLESGDSSINFKNGECHALVGKAGFRMTDSEMSIVHVAAPPPVATMITTAEETYETARAAAEKGFDTAKTTIDTGMLLAVSAVGAFLGAGVGAGVGLGVGTAVGGGTGAAAGAGIGLAAGLVGTGALAAGTIALGTFCKQQSDARNVADKAIKAAKKIKQTALKAAHEANKLAINTAVALPITPKLTIKSDSIVVSMGTTKVEVKATGVEIDAGVGLITLKGGGSQLKLGPGTAELDAGPGALTLKAGGKECMLSAVAWKTPDTQEL